MSRLGFLEGGGEMGEITRNYDWSKTSLGIPENWPRSLQTTVGIILHSAFPMFLFWGKELLCFYNDAYRPSLGNNGKHPLIAKGGQESWTEIWGFIGPLIEQVIATGEAVWFEDQFLPIYRNGKMEDVYWTFSYSPAYGDDGKIAGVFVTCTETTEKVKALAAANDVTNQLKFAIDAADLGTWELNPVTNKFRGNSRLKEWFGLQPEEEIELSLATNVIAEKDRAKVNEAILYALTFESGGLYDIEYTIQNPVTGIETVVKAKGRAYFNEQNQPYTFSGTLQDVSEEAKIKKQLAIELAEQKRIYRQVEESEAHLQLLRDTVPAMIFYLDPEQRYQSYNGVFREWFNVNGTEAIGKTTREFIGEAAYQKAEPHLTKAYAGERVEYHMHAPQKIGGAKWLNIVYTPHKNSDGKVLGIIVHATDITEHILALQKIEESEARFRNLLQEAPVAAALFRGPDLIIEVANELTLKYWGKTNDIIGKPLAEAAPELEDQQLIALVRNVYENGGMSSFSETPIRFIEDGVLKEGFYSFSLKALYNSNGEVESILSTGIDVTEQVNVRKQIEQKEKELRDLIAASPIGICVLSGEPLRVEEVNERFLQISGKTREQYTTAPYWEVLKEVAHIFQPILANVFASGQKYTTEESEMVLIRDGVPENIFLTFEYIPVFEKEQVIKVMVMVVEVTHQAETRKRIEEAVVERTKELADSNLRLKRSNEELEQFAYIASHDLQEPVRKISTFTQILEQSIQDISPKSQDYISKIYKSTDRMTKLIRDVLAFSRIKEEASDFEKVDLNKIMETLKSDYELQIEETHAVLEITGLPIVEAVSLQMIQLFGNLLSNSLKYRKQDTKPVIKITASVAKPEKVAKRMVLDGNVKYYHIAFSDNGIGFDQDHVDRIFKIFQRLHGKTEFEGTGIGLAICRRIVQNHRGHISAAVGENGGAVFNILLPEVQ